jgi:hypothetical protein
MIDSTIQQDAVERWLDQLSPAGHQQQRRHVAEERDATAPLSDGNLQPVEAAEKLQKLAATGSDGAGRSECPAPAQAKRAPLATLIHICASSSGDDDGGASESSTAVLVRALNAAAVGAGRPRGSDEGGQAQEQRRRAREEQQGPADASLQMEQLQGVIELHSVSTCEGTLAGGSGCTPQQGTDLQARRALSHLLDGALAQVASTSTVSECDPAFQEQHAPGRPPQQQHEQQQQPEPQQEPLGAAAAGLGRRAELPAAPSAAAGACGPAARSPQQPLSWAASAPIGTLHRASTSAAASTEGSGGFAAARSSSARPRRSSKRHHGSYEAASPAASSGAAWALAEGWASDWSAGGARAVKLLAPPGGERLVPFAAAAAAAAAAPLRRLLWGPSAAQARHVQAAGGLPAACSVAQGRATLGTAAGPSLGAAQ